jgi:hypothetical protein
VHAIDADQEHAFEVAAGIVGVIVLGDCGAQHGGNCEEEQSNGFFHCDLGR